MPGIARNPRTSRRLAMLLLLIVASALLYTLARPDMPSELPVDPAPIASRALDAARNRLLGPPRVGVQVGHLDAASHPEELARLRYSTGGHAQGINEVDVNRRIATALAARLEARGLLVDLLPATVPPRYRADLVVSIHADSSPDPWRRGYKSAVYRDPRNDWDATLKQAIDRAFLTGSGLADDDINVSGDMLEYYAFNPRYRHSVARSTPALLVELGYLSNADDRAFLADPERAAALLERGIVDFLGTRGRIAGQ